MRKKRAITTTSRELHHLSLGEVERQHILMVLSMCDSNRTAAAQILEIGLRTLQRKLRRYGVSLSSAQVQPLRTKHVIASLVEENALLNAIAARSLEEKLRRGAAAQPVNEGETVSVMDNGCSV